MKMPRMLWIVALGLTVGLYFRPARAAVVPSVSTGTSLSKNAVVLDDKDNGKDKGKDDFKAPDDKDTKSKTKPGDGNDQGNNGNGQGNNGQGNNGNGNGNGNSNGQGNQGNQGGNK